MMNEFALINDAKEKLCFVSTEFNALMKSSQYSKVNEFDRDFVLPDFVHTFEGTVELPMALKRRQQQAEEKKLNGETDDEDAAEEDFVPKQDSVDDDEEQSEGEENDETNNYSSDEETPEQRIKRLEKVKLEERRRLELEALEKQVLPLSVERFTVPEILFRPRDILNMQQSIGNSICGIPETIVQSIEACDASLHTFLYRNILLVGGNSKFPCFRDRIEKEVRALAPPEFEVRVFEVHDGDPTGYSWTGAQQYCLNNFLNDNEKAFRDETVSRLAWESHKKQRKNNVTPQTLWKEVEEKQLRTSGLKNDPSISSFKIM